MPVFIYIYLIFFLLMLVFNVIYLIQTRSKLIIVLYEVCEALFLVFMVASYFLDFLKLHHGIWILPAYIFIITIDLYISVWGDIREFGIRLPEEMDEKEIEYATIISLIFTSPAYFIAGLVCLEFIIKNY